MIKTRQQLASNVASAAEKIRRHALQIQADYRQFVGQSCPVEAVITETVISEAARTPRRKAWAGIEAEIAAIEARFT